MRLSLIGRAHVSHLINVYDLFTLDAMLENLPVTEMKPGQLLARGVCRHLRYHDFVSVEELVPTSGLRVDVMALGPKGEVWEIYKSLAKLLEACRQVLSDKPLFVVATVYAVQASAIHVGQALEAMMLDFSGYGESGELVTREKSAGRLFSHAVFARWESGA